MRHQIDADAGLDVPRASSTDKGERITRKQPMIRTLGMIRLRPERVRFSRSGIVEVCSAMLQPMLIDEAVTGSIIGAFYRVYNKLGFGFLESLYVAALERELNARGHDVGREVGVRVMYDGIELGLQRLDLIVDQRVVVEVKSTSELHKHATRQVYNYLRATHLEVGLLLHFGPEPRFYRVMCRNSSSGSNSSDLSG
jgi:GxxExxY protein